MYNSGAICPALMTLCYDFWSYSIVCVMFGLFLSAWPAVTSSCLVDILGLEHLTSAFGVLTCIRGLSAFLGPPLGGFVIDATSPEKTPVVNIYLRLQNYYNNMHKIEKSRENISRIAKFAL